MKKILLFGMLVFVITSTFVFIRARQANEIKTDCESKLKSFPNGEIFQGTPVSTDLTSFPEAKRFYTRITEAVKTGPNFAGHFTLAYWGCGTECFGYAVVDAITGGIVTYSPTNPNTHLRNDYKINQPYFILDPTDEGGEKKFYGIKNTDGRDKLELLCSE